MVTLFPHQVEAIESLNIAFDAGINRAMANLATGTGKTIMALEWMRLRGGKGIFVCPFDAVVQQSFEAAYKVMPNKRLGIVQAERDQHHADIIVASLHTIQKEKRLQRLTKDFDSIVIDEAHLMPEAYIKVLEALENQHSKTLGLSATPYRLPGSKIELTDIWQATPVIISIEDAVDKGFLATPTGIKIQLKDADFSGVKVKRGDFDQKAIETVMDHCNWKEAITEEWRKHAGSRRTLAYVGSVNQAHALSEYMRSVGIRAESLDGSISNQRPAMKRRFEAGETQVLVNVGTLTTGFDAPCTDAILMARFTTSRALYVQIVGRGLRNHPGKTDCLILDVVGNFKKHPTLGFDDLVGAKKRDVIAQPETMAEARSRAQQELFEETQKQLEQERLEAIRVELIRKKQEERARQNARNAARWIEGDYRYTYEVWDRVFTIRPSATGGYKLLDTKGLFQEYATVDEAKAAAAPLIQKATFADPNAPWRRRSGIEPASEAQRRQLDRFRVRYQPEITKAEASDLLNAVFARLDAARQKL